MFFYLLLLLLFFLDHDELNVPVSRNIENNKKKLKIKCKAFFKWKFLMKNYKKLSKSVSLWLCFLIDQRL